MASFMFIVLLKLNILTDMSGYCVCVVRGVGVVLGGVVGGEISFFTI